MVNVVIKADELPVEVEQKAMVYPQQALCCITSGHWQSQSNYVLANLLVTMKGD